MDITDLMALRREDSIAKPSSEGLSKREQRKLEQTLKLFASNEVEVVGV
jgi:hypothetical protein